MSAVNDLIRIPKGHLTQLDASNTNPKDLIGVKKVSLGLLPAVGEIYGSLAMEHGASKYGAFNWRVKSVSMMVYLNAIKRHMAALIDGQDIASDSGVHHLGHIIANASIILDAMELGKLKDDRPSPGKSAEVLERFEKK